MALHPLEPLSGDEFRRTAEILRRDRGVTESWRFASIELKEPAKPEVKAGRRATPSHGRRSRCCGTERTNQPMRRSST